MLRRVWLCHPRPSGKPLWYQKQLEMSQKWLFGFHFRRGAGRIMPDSIGQDLKSPEPCQDISGAGSILEAEQNRSKWAAKIQEKCWGRPGFIWVKAHMQVPPFYTTAFYISNKKKEKEMCNYIVFSHYLRNYFYWNSSFPCGFELLVPLSFQLKEPPLVFLLRKAC